MNLLFPTNSLAKVLTRLRILCHSQIVMTCMTKSETRPRGYKTFFMLNSAEHELFTATKYENANKSWHFHIY